MESIKKTVIFDFDGTIADTFSSVVEIVNGMSDQYGFEKLSIEEISALRHMKAQDIWKKFRPLLFKLPALVFAVKKTLGTQIANIKSFEGMSEVLHALKAKGCALGIVSSNNIDTVQAFLKNNNLSDFDFVFCEKNLFGKGRVLKRLLKTYSIDPRYSYYVGDETRDIEAARTAEIKVISVDWGFNAAAALEQMHPDFLISSPDELLQIV